MVQRIYNGMGRVSERAGKLVSYLVGVLILSIVYDVFARYMFNAPTIWSFTLSYMLGAIIISIGMCYVYYHNANVRVDLIYNKLPAKGRRLIDICLSILFFFPFVLMLTWVWTKDTCLSFSLHEVATESIWYPILWPFKLLVTIGLFLLLMQGVATFLKDLASLRKGGGEPW